MTLPADRRQIRGACALDCPDTCSWVVTLEGDRPVALRGDPAHPCTRGALCNKVADYLAYARSPDRVLHPMRRVAPKGSSGGSEDLSGSRGTRRSRRSRTGCAT